MARGKSDNKTQPTLALVEAFLDTVTPDARREDARALCALMARLSGEPATMWGPTIIGFGAYHYRYESGREGDMPRVAFSPRRPALVLYISDFPQRDALVARIGRHTAGKGCLYAKGLADLDLAVLEALIAGSLAWMREAYPPD